MSSLIRGKTGKFRWQVLSDWEPVLFGPEGLRLEEWRAAGQVQVVKHGVHRTVYLVELPERSFYVKHRRPVRLGDLARQLVVATAARREWRKAVELARRGIPTIKPVAWQERIESGLVWDSFLVTEEIRQVCSLEEYARRRLWQLPHAAQRSMRRRIIRSLARFSAAIHRAGVVHNDFHLGNVLLQPAGSESKRSDGLLPLYLIDVPGVRFSRPLRWPASRDSLVMLNSGWWEQTSRTQRQRFWRTYLLERPDLKLPNRQAALEEMDLGTRDYARQVARRRDRRSLGTNRDYLALHEAGREAHGVDDLPESELRRLMEDPEALLWRNLDRPVKLGHGSLMVQAELPLSGRAARVIYKRYRPRNWWKALLSRFRRSRALRSWRAAHALLLRRIATPRPLAVCQLRGGPRGCCGYLATEWIEGAENLHLYGWRLSARPADDRLRRAARCAQSLGALVGRMHAWGIAHGDLKGSNLLVVERRAGIETYLIDADDLRIGKRPDWRRQIADLARLATSVQAHCWVSRTTVCRFFRAYRRQFPPQQLAWKALWREAADRSRRMIRRKRRRGEPLL